MNPRRRVRGMESEENMRVMFSFVLGMSMTVFWILIQHLNPCEPEASGTLCSHHHFFPQTVT
jgi:hypothetical protein